MALSDATHSSAYTARAAHLPVDREVILSLWLDAHAALTPTTMAAKLQRQYVDNPAGTGLLLLLEHGRDADPVGVQGLMPRRFALGERAFRAGTLADYAVTARHRSLWPALSLLRATSEAGHASMDFLYSFTNRKSEAVFRRSGMPSPTGLRRYVRPLRSEHRVAGLMHGAWHRMRGPATAVIDALLAIDNLGRFARTGRRWRWTDQQDFGPVFDDIWNGSRRAGWLVGERSAEMLRWRYPKGNGYRISVATDRRNGRPEGYAVWRCQSECIDILDFFCREADAQLAGLLSSFAWQYGGADIQSIALEFAGPQALSMAMARAGFRDRGSNPVFLATRQADISALPVDSIYLTSFDRDSG